MRYATTAIARLVLVLALAAIVAPAALGNGGRTPWFHPNAQPSIAKPHDPRISPYARLSRGPVSATVVTGSGSDAFDWTDAGVGAGAAFVAAPCIGPLLVVRRAGRKRLARI
jgi:hypothetical protein